MKEKTKHLLCLTPVRNEGWILDKFLKAASIWADTIIIADQNSNDNSKEIAKRFDKVILIDNNGEQYGENERQDLLIKEARKIKGDNILIALDADEFLTLNDKSLKELEVIKQLKRGTIIKFKWNNVKLKDVTYWEASDKMPFGFVDDGTEHIGQKIHSPRVPIPENAPVYYPKHLEIMHYQYADWERMKSKHRWYQCWEVINNSGKSSIDIYRQYHHMYSIPRRMLDKIPENWFYFYDRVGIDLKKIESKKHYWWDKEILKLLDKYGTSKFSRVDIWDRDWIRGDVVYKDPRDKLDILENVYLKSTQPFINCKILGPLIYLTDVVIKKLFGI
ncbi:MAG: hypothetical protein UT14_C0002G0020 [Candidatus Shapirobacteria bacterium GW2011_GWE1_38_92]|uniref:Glycosyltransferase 2-like domain-containing protein n=3 Tax=Candidatus Shapironibacteriota TaxID=1752721 RepID=A0A0G0MC81_9BACT|nr:MAG: hypothetical protein US90_C0003G0017 [Candidatus Shapirobacteria bacterium GW2011_GWE2_38_30]KKQ92836.1 MAG: hypothetical protein UT14_C0002G0020 [Candidatus Shapirobacteria bacterium GW2011_GWE1_38_92]OGL56313.1 MAG: hypothetical protein A2367_03375 [Candidatus Shapirobacteria bacterium RIFOXYB1_FULL_38_38]